MSRVGSLLHVLRPLPLVALAAGSLVLAGSAPDGGEPDLAAALAQALGTRALQVEATQVHWLDRPSTALGALFTEPRAIVLARRAGEPADVYLARVQLTPEGRLLRVAELRNLTDTSAVDERSLIVNGQRFAWTIGDDRTYSIHLGDLRGEPPPQGDGWTRTKRWQHQLTNLQETGQVAGIGRRAFKLDPAPSQLELAFAHDELLVEADGRQVRISTDGHGIVEGGRFVQEQPHALARPGNLVTWSVDRVRALPWFGSDRMQAVKAVAFSILDQVDQVKGSVTGDDGSAAVKDELGELLEVPVTEYTDPETGWPPKPLDPVMSRVLEGEGKWRTLENDPFVRTNPGAPAPFATTFIRVDRKRQFDQIWVTMWDPRQVELHMMSGTVEPKSATGETGPGVVPRRPEVMGRLLAGLNGGFQAEHGEYGMMADGVVYLPPKPYAATIALLQDGSNAFGTWPASDAVPPNVVSFRQNMTPLVMDGKVNPYQRNWWGGVPPGWEHEARTTRSAICMTEEGFVAYFYGASTDDVHLIEAVQRARCKYAIHLDMNAGHTGLEYYRAGPTREVPPLGRPLDDRWEAEGDVSGMAGWRFRGRRMLRYMGLMNFPRYISRESRDFFYLTLRHLVPGEPLATALDPAEAGEGSWQVQGLPQHGWPYSLATTWLRPDAKHPDTKVRLLQLDPKVLRAAEERDSNERLVVAFEAPKAGRGTGLYLVPGGFRLSATAPSDGARLLAMGVPPGDPAAEHAVAAVGIAPSGLLYYAEIASTPNATDREVLVDVLRRLGCAESVLFTTPVGLALGGVKTLAGHPATLSRKAARLLRGEGPGATRIFPDTPVVAPQVWYPLQSKRVRYFKKKKPPAPAAAPSAE